MSAGPKYLLFRLYSHHRYEYLWTDGVKIKKPIRVSAPEYIDYLLTWVQDTMDDPTIFPLDNGISLIVLKII